MQGRRPARGDGVEHLCAARQALDEFDARQAAADAAAEVTRQRQSEYDDALRGDQEAFAAQARSARDGTEADASKDIFNAMAEIRMAASRRWRPS